MLDKSALIIDDSATARTMLKHKLQKFDVMVESACDGFEALHILQTRQPDVIFLDHIMPGMDGFQVLDQLKANPLTASIPVVMYTSQAAPKYTVEAMALGAVGVMPKQVGNKLLSQMLDKAEQYQQGFMYKDVPAEDQILVSSSSEGSSSPPADSETLEVQASGDLAESCTENTASVELKPNTPTPRTSSFLMRLAIFSVLVVQGFSLYHSQQQQHLIRSMEQEITFQQQQYSRVSLELQEQREANQATLAQFQFVMDAVVSEVLNQNKETDRVEVSTPSFEQEQLTDETLAQAFD